MPVYIALLRAVNVGGTGKLPMPELRGMCEALGFTQVRTYIASGNVVFESRLGEASVKKKLEQSLEAYAGKPVGVVVRTATELGSVLQGNPFPAAAPEGDNKVAQRIDEPGEAIASAKGEARHEQQPIRRA